MRLQHPCPDGSHPAPGRKPTHQECGYKRSERARPSAAFEEVEALPLLDKYGLLIQGMKLATHLHGCGSIR